jgi:transcriptional regulator with XRE-family HTH domain
MRRQLGLSASDVEERSQQLAVEHGNPEFLMSRGRVIQVENSETTPSIYKLCSLSAIYGVPISELIDLFVDLSSISGQGLRIGHDQSRVLRFETGEPGKRVQFPIAFNPGFNPDATNLLSRVVQAWGEVPIGLIQELNLRSLHYGMIGLSDYTLYPLLRPGSFVQIDKSQRKIASCPASNEYDRPIWFVELHQGYVCGWCEMHQGRLVVAPHPLSPCRIRIFDYPGEAEIVGRVVAVAARLAPAHEAAEASATQPRRTAAAGQ